GPQGEALSVIAEGTGALDHAVLASLDTTPLSRGNYLLQLVATAADGSVATDTAPFTRLLERRYLRQLTHLPMLVGVGRDNVVSDDGRNIVWTELGNDGVLRITRFDPVANLSHPVGLGSDARVSGDGSTLAFIGPQDQSPDNQNVQ